MHQNPLLSPSINKSCRRHGMHCTGTVRKQATTPSSMSDILSRYNSRCFRRNNYVNPLCSELHAIHDLISKQLLPLMHQSLLNYLTEIPLINCKADLLLLSKRILHHSSWIRLKQPNRFTESKHQILKINTWTEIFCIFNNEVVIKTTYGLMRGRFEPWNEESRVRSGLEILRGWRSSSLNLSPCSPLIVMGSIKEQQKDEGKGWRVEDEIRSTIIHLLLSPCVARMKD